MESQDQSGQGQVPDVSRETSPSWNPDDDLEHEPKSAGATFEAKPLDVPPSARSMINSYHNRRVIT